MASTRIPPVRSASRCLFCACLWAVALILLAAGCGAGDRAAGSPADSTQVAGPPIGTAVPTASPSPTPSPSPTSTLSPGESFAPTIALSPTPSRAPETGPAGTPTALPAASPEPAARPAASPSPTASPTAPAPPPAGVVNSDSVNLRSGPGTNYDRLGQVQTGQAVEIVGRPPETAGGWWQVCCPLGEDRPAWISAEFVDVGPDEASRLTSVPLVEIPATPTPAPAASASTAARGEAPGAAALAAPPASGLPGPGDFDPPAGPNPLTGLPLPADRPSQRPVAVCVNNDVAARPQFGLAEADLVYEYLMEGYGITRFTAIFFGQGADRIGPVRSARLINYYLSALYNAPLFCSGGSDPVRYLLKNEAPFPYLDVDLDDPSNRFYSLSLGRDYRTRLQTDSGRLRRWLADWGVEAPAGIRGFTFGDAPAGGAPATAIDLPFAAATGSQAAFTFEPGSGRYLRFMGDEPHVDAASGRQLAVDNVIVQFVAHQPTDIVEDSLGSTGIRLDLFGQGPAVVFRDGLAFNATWRSETRGDTPRFFDEAGGAEIPLRPGQSWISIVPLDFELSYE